MPDHLHALVEGLAERFGFPAVRLDVQQRCGYRWRQAGWSSLWQEGYYDHVLRDGEDIAGIVAYILNNPVRAGLCGRPEDYPHLGSDRYTFAMLADAVQIRTLPW